jgi:hypothetical protein
MLWLPWSWTWTGVLDVTTAAATVSATILAWRALQSIVNDRRMTYELERLREIRIALDNDNIIELGTRRAVNLGLRLLPGDVLPLTRRAYAPGFNFMYDALDEAGAGDPTENNLGGVMPDEKTVAEHLRAEADAAINKRLGRGGRWRGSRR